MTTAEYIMGQFNGSVYAPNRLDIQHGFLFDDLALNKCRFRGVHEFFHTPCGSYDLISQQIKGITNTNLYTGNRLDAPEAFAVQRLLFTFNKEADERDVMVIAENCLFSFGLGYKYYIRCLINLLPCQRREFEPLRLCGKCRTLYMGDGNCPSCGSGLRPLPLPGGTEIGRQFFLDLLINIVIANQADFRVELITEKEIKLKGPVKMWCHLEGLHAKGVQ